MKCNICENQIQKNWKHCPQCGIQIKDSKLTHEGYSIERIRDVWIKKGGETFYENSKSIENASKLPYTKVKPIRYFLGDYIDIHFSNIKPFSILSIQPELMGELCDIYRLIGYYSVDHALKAIKMSRIVDIISKSGLSWKLLSNQKIQRELIRAWRELNQALLEVTSIDNNKKQITYKIEEGQLTYLESGKPLNFIDLNILGGNLEAVCNMKCIGEERIDKQNKYFTYRLLPKKERIEYPVIHIDKNECNEIMKKLVGCIIDKKPSNRRKLEDKVHISGEQIEAYFMLRITEGHKILEKYSGIKVGKELSREAKINGEEEALTFTQKIFEQEKVGLLGKPLKREDKIVLNMNESAYSSGIYNSHMKLDIFLAGIIEGILNQATEERWDVEETKCLANGDEHCEFTCKKQI